MDAPGAPFDKGGEKDVFETSMAASVFLQIFFWLYIIGFVASIFLILNFSVPHSFFITSPPGTLVTQRYNSLRWWFFMLAAARLFVPIVALQLLSYRRNRGCFIFWLIFLFLFVLLDICVFINFTFDFVNCNGQNEWGNFCNDPLWCCVEEIYENGSNRCPNTVGCNPPVVADQLRADPYFLVYWWSTLAFVLLDMLLFLVPTGLAFGAINKEQAQRAKEYMLPVSSSINALVQNLRGGKPEKSKI